MLGLTTSRASASACPTVAHTPFFTLLYGAATFDNAPAVLGSTVEALNPRGDVVGCFEITTVGQYGTMFVYGEDTSVEPPLAGMRVGETITLRLAGKPVSNSPLPIWTDDRDLHLINLQAQTIGYFIFLPVITR